jgi:hypothetical protein
MNIEQPTVYVYDILLDETGKRLFTRETEPEAPMQVSVKLKNALTDWYDPEMVFTVWVTVDGNIHSLQSGTMCILGENIAAIRLVE